MSLSDGKRLPSECRVGMYLERQSKHEKQDLFRISLRLRAYVAERTYEIEPVPTVRGSDAYGTPWSAADIYHALSMRHGTS